MNDGSEAGSARRWSFFALATAVMAEGLIAAEEQGKFILWNPAASKIVGLDAADVLPEQWSAHYGAYLPDKVTPFPVEQNPLLRAMRGEVSSAEIFFHKAACEGGMWIESNGAPLRTEDGVLLGGVAGLFGPTQRSMQLRHSISR